MKSTTINSLLVIIVTLFLFSCGDDGVDPNNPSGAKELVDISTPTTLSNHRDGVDYIVKTDISFRALVTIEPGVEIQFEPGSYIVVHSNGGINASGTSSDRIRFTNKGEGIATWSGIYINSQNPLNQLINCNIEYAGAVETFGTFNQYKAAVTLDDGQLSMNNCVVSNSDGAGFVTVESIGSAVLRSFSNNVFENNKSFPIIVSQNNIPELALSSCTYTDNLKNMIGINSYNGDRLTQTAVLSKLPIPYYVIQGFELYAGMTIEAGAEMIFGNGAFITVARTTGTPPYLTIQGTQSNHVVLRGEEALVGYWKGVRLETTNAKNIFEYADISDGGGDSDASANIVMYNGGTNLTLNNCTSARSGSCDVLFDNFLGTPVLTNNSPQISNICMQ